jgi:signal transduction histidine kinase
MPQARRQSKPHRKADHPLATGDQGLCRFPILELHEFRQNAVQHGSQFGTITVSAQGDQRDVRIEVHNEGPAIDVEHLKDIFEPLHRAASETARNRGSLGLGLYIVRRLALAHGGSVSVTSTEADGARFVVVVPKKR